MTSSHRTGFFLTFEGSEGCGKSTQIQRLLANLRQHQIQYVLVREPGGTPVGEIIRHLIQHSPEAESLVPEAELLLFAASRAQLVREIINPSLHAGKFVISDRFLDSTTVYQGIARQLPPEDVKKINQFTVGDCLPDFTFLLDMEPIQALQRARAKNSPTQPADRMEQQPEDFYRRVRDGYLATATAEPHRFKILDASLPEDLLAQQIWQTLLSTKHAIFQRIRP